MIHFTSFAAMLNALPTDAACREYLELKRWNGAPVCPHCGVIDEKHYRLTVKGEFKGMYKCKSCKERFTVTLGTMFEGSPIPLRKWFIATYIFSAHKKGISSHQLARDLGVTQKTAWFMLHRLRMCFGIENDTIELGGNDSRVEMDESYVGGEHKNKHSKRRKEMNEKGTGYVNKTPVFGILERGGKVFVSVVKEAKGSTLKPIIEDVVSSDTTVITDGFGAYSGLNKKYNAHEIINHAQNEYKRGEFHTNNIEGFWSQLKRGIDGIYHQVDPKHLQAYCCEFGFRYNSRKISDKERFDKVLTMINGAKLDYNTLISK